MGVPLQIMRLGRSPRVRLASRSLLRFRIEMILADEPDFLPSQALSEVVAALSASDVRYSFVSIDMFTDGAWRTLTLSLDAQCLADGFVI